MKNPKLANRYAKALFDYAGEQGQIETVFKDLSLICETLKENEELQIVLNSPVVVPLKKHSIFTSLFREKLSELSFTFLDIIIRKKREPFLTEICTEYRKYYNELHHIKVVEVTSAQPLSPSIVEKIRSTMAEQTQHTIEIEEHVNPTIIGGVQIKMDDFYFDASISSKINKLRQEFSNNIYQANY